MLRWVCSHIICHTHPSTTPYSIDQTHLFHPLTDFACSDVISVVKDFPINLTLVKEERRPELSVGSKGGHVLASEQWDWGPLVSHCYSSYWESLLTFLKRFNTAFVPFPPSHVCKENWTIGSSDVLGIAECCISSLDMAASSLGLVIQALVTLIPKVCILNSNYLFI